MTESSQAATSKTGIAEVDDKPAPSGVSRFVGDFASSSSFGIGLLLATQLLVSCAASHEPLEWTEPQTGMQFVLVREGTFQMGSPNDERGREPQESLHQVEITRAFYLGRFEVTQAEWQKVMGQNPSRFQECGPACPVEEISWNDAMDFVARLAAESGERLRLPTEAEWEYACRSGTSTPFASGHELSTDEANYDGDPPVPGWPSGIDRKRTTKVGTFPANAWGLHDMHGNVWEFTADWHCPYPPGPVVDPRGQCDSGLRVIRGGSWHFGPDSARCGLRYTHRPQDTGPSLGFRVVREIPID